MAKRKRSTHQSGAPKNARAQQAYSKETPILPAAMRAIQRAAATTPGGLGPRGLHVDPAMIGAMTFYAASCYDRFEQIGFDKAKAAADFCSQWSMEYPLFLREAKTKDFPHKDIPEFGDRSSIYAMALMTAFIVWLQIKAHGLAATEKMIREMENSQLLQAALSGLMFAKVKVQQDPQKEEPPK